MTNMSQMIGADSLLDVQWDTDKIHKVFSEILSLFNQHEKKIVELNEKLEKKCEKEDFTTLENRVKDNEDQLLHEKELGKQKFKEVHDSILKQIDETQNWAEDLNLSTLGEARRLVSTEIQALAIPEKVDTSDFVKKTEIADFEKKIASLQSDLDAIMVPSNDKNLAPDVMQNIRILAVEKRCESIEQQLLGFSKIENDVNDLLLSFPAITKKLERKINNLINQYEKPNVYKVSPRAAPPPLENSYKNISKPQPKPTITTHKTPQKPSEPKKLEPLDQTDKEPKEEEKKEINEEIKKIDEIIEKPVEVEIPPSAEIIEEMPALPTPPQTIQFEETTGNGKQKIEKITEKTNDNTVTVIENRTYTTELQSSMRVVTEIEWCKQLITQHHEAIRQLQNNTRTQSENYEHISDSLVRMNSTHNSRISQLAQQQLHFRQEIDDLRKISVEQFQHTKQKIKELENAPQQAPVTTIIEKEKISSKPHTPSSTRKSVRKLDPLPPLPPQTYEDSYYSDYNEEEQQPEEKESLPPKEKEEEADKTSGKKSQRRKIVVPTMLSVSHHTEDIPPEVIFGYVARKTDGKGKMFNEQIEKTEKEPKKSVEESQEESSNEPPPPGTVSGPTWPMSSGRAEEREVVQKTVLLSSTQLPIPEHQVVQVSAAYGNGVKNGRLQTAGEQQVVQLPGITRAEIDEEVAKSASQFVRDMVENQNKEFQSQLVEFRKETDRVVSLLDQKIDRSFTERMFDKIRLMLSAFKGEIENMQSSFLDWVTREELEIVLQQFSSLLNASDDSAATNSKYTCLLCGRPKQHLAGMLEGDKTMHETRSVPRKTTNAFDRPTYQKSGAKSEMKRPPPRDPISYLTN